MLDLAVRSVVVFRRIGGLVVNRVSVFGRLVVVLKHGFQTKLLYSLVHITRDLFLFFPSSASRDQSKYAEKKCQDLLRVIRIRLYIIYSIFSLSSKMTFYDFATSIVVYKTSDYIIINNVKLLCENPFP